MGWCRHLFVFLALSASVITSASAQQVDCQRLFEALTTAPPGAFTPEQAQDMANVYNAECLGQQQAQYPQPQQSNNEAEAIAEAFGQFIGALMRR